MRTPTSPFIRIKEKVSFYEIKSDGYSGMSKFEFPIYLAPENALVSSVQHISNKLFGHSQADFHIVINNVINRTVLVEKIEFRSGASTIKTTPINKNEIDKKSGPTSKNAFNPNKVSVKSVHPQISNLEMLRNESLGVLLSLNKETNFFVN